MKMNLSFTLPLFTSSTPFIHDLFSSFSFSSLQIYGADGSLLRAESRRGRGKGRGGGVSTKKKPQIFAYHYIMFLIKRQNEKIKIKYEQ